MERHSFLSNQTITQQSSFMFHAESSIFRAPEGRCMLLMFHRADPISLYISGGVSFILHLFSRELTPFPQDARYILPSREIISFLEGFISHLSSWYWFPPQGAHDFEVPNPSSRCLTFEVLIPSSRCSWFWAFFILPWSPFCPRDPDSFIEMPLLSKLLLQGALVFKALIPSSKSSFPAWATLPLVVLISSLVRMLSLANASR